jgi:predicted PurR-regulated permease PerM
LKDSAEQASPDFVRRVFVGSIVVASVAFVLLFVWYAADLLLLVFAGLLISILLRRFSELLRRSIPMPAGVSLALVSLLLAGFTGIGFWVVTGRIGSQISDLQNQLPQAIANMRQQVAQHAWAQNAIDSLPNISEWLAQRSGTLSTGADSRRSEGSHGVWPRHCSPVYQCAGLKCPRCNRRSDQLCLDLDLRFEGSVNGTHVRDLQ